MRIYLCAILIFFGLSLTAQTRTWTAAEWWASVTGHEALLHIGVDTTACPKHLNADGAVTWAVLEGHLASDSRNYLDIRTKVAAIQRAKGKSTGAFTTTSPNDPRLTYMAWAWSPVEEGETPRIKRAVIDGAISNPMATIKSLNRLAGNKKVVRVFRTGMLGVNRANRKGRHPKDGGEHGSQDVVNGTALPWYDTWISNYGSQIQTWAQTIDNAGIKVDMIIYDTEMDPAAAWHYDAGDMEVVMADPRWPELAVELAKYGYDTVSLSPPDKRGTYQQSIWNAVMWNRFNAAVSRATNCARTIWPNLTYHDYSIRYTSGRGLGHNYYQSRYGWGTLSSITGDYQTLALYNFAQAYYLPWGSEEPRYSDGKRQGGLGGDSWDGLLSDVMQCRQTVGASNIPIIPWIGGISTTKAWYDPDPATTYWKESLYHAGLTGQTVGFSLYNPDIPQGIDMLDSVLIELSDRVGYVNQRPLSVEIPSYSDDVVISGVDAGGKLTYRVSWNYREITDPANEINWPDGTVLYDANGVGAWVINESSGGMSKQ